MHNLRSVIFSILVCAMIVFSSVGSAVSFNERGRYYLYVTTSDTPMYSSDSSADETSLTQTGVLPAGTPVSSGDEIGSSYRRITYMDENGSTHSVIVDKSVIKSNYATLDFTESIGKIAIPIPAMANSEWVSDYLSYRGKTVSLTEIENALAAYSGTVTPAPVAENQVTEENDTVTPEELAQEEADAAAEDGAVTDEAADTEEASADPETVEDSENDTSESASTEQAETSSQAKVKPQRQTETSNSAVPDSNIYLQSDDGQLVLVAVKQLGISRSIVEIKGQEYEVETSMLVWNTTADADHRIAVVHAPKSGKASLRKTEKSSSKTIKSLGSGTVIAVFDMQDDMSGVYYDGLVGYMKNSSLLYFSSEREYQTAVLTYNGSTTNTHRINMYNLPRESSRRLVGLRAGMAATVFGEEGEFYEIEVNGRHGYIYTKFVTLDDVPSELSVLPGDLSDEAETTEEDADTTSDESDTASDTELINEDSNASEDVVPPETDSTDNTDSESDASGDASESEDASANTGYEPFIVNGYDMHRNPYN